MDSGWYVHPDDPQWFAEWDGEKWTGEFRPASSSPPSSSPVGSPVNGDQLDAPLPVFPLWLRILFSLFPLVCVVFFGWEASYVITYYWAQNAAILLTEPFFMKTAYGERAAAGLPVLTSEIKINGTPATNFSANQVMWLIIPFFIFHFGMFTVVHGVFLAAFGLFAFGNVIYAVAFQTIRRIFVDRKRELAILRKGSVGHQYKTVIPLHVTIIVFGAFMAFNDASTYAVAALCIIGAAIEVSAGRKK